MHSVIADAFEVRLVGGNGGMSLTDALTALAAVASPVVALIVALLVTSRTITNDREQRALDRNQEWGKQLQEQQLQASADFASLVFASLVQLERLNPLDHEPSSNQLTESRRKLELARPEMSKVQLLFGRTDSDSREAAQTAVDSLDTAQVALERRNTTADAVIRAKQEAEYASALGAARAAYNTFLKEASSAIASRPDLRSTSGD